MAELYCLKINANTNIIWHMMKFGKPAKRMCIETFKLKLMNNQWNVFKILESAQNAGVTIVKCLYDWSHEL